MLVKSAESSHFNSSLEIVKIHCQYKRPHKSDIIINSTEVFVFRKNELVDIICHGVFGTF